MWKKLRGENSFAGAALVVTLPGNEDAMIAATAEVHDLTVVTRTIRDFAVFGARTFNPFGEPPPARRT